MVSPQYDVIIVGAGPAGLFAAHELVKKQKHKILIIDKGADVLERTKTHNYMCGVGGAGGLSDGKLNLSPYIGGDLTLLAGSETKAEELIKEVDSTFTKFGTPRKILFDKKKAEKLMELANKAGVQYIPIRQKHIGTDRLVKVISNFKRYLEEHNVKFMLNTEVTDLIVKDRTVKGVRTPKRRITSKYVIIAPGREGQHWFVVMAKKHDIKLEYTGIDVGVRIETKYDVMKEVTDINYDPKIHICAPTTDDFVRTFCTNPKGYVVMEKYGDFIGVNGHATNDIKSENTNFALLVRVELTQPVENTNDYGRSIAHLATTIGGGKPILQRLEDFKKGRRSTWDRIGKSFVEPTLKEVTPGDISMALPARIVLDIKESIEKLDGLIKGINSEATLLYAPEIKYYSLKAHIKKNFEWSIKNVFLAGDGVGLTRDIVNSAATGILAAQGIVAKR